MYKVVFIEQGSHEWLAWRRSVITATDASVIMNANYYTSKEMLWRRKLNIAPEQKCSRSMNLGIILEPKARQKFTEHTGIHLESSVVINIDRPWQASSLDGLSIDGTISAEIKCSEKIYINTVNGIIDESHQWQMLHQMSTTGHDWMYYIAYWKDLISVKIYRRNQKLIDLLNEEEIIFYNCLQNFSLPNSKEKKFSINNQCYLTNGLSL